MKERGLADHKQTSMVGTGRQGPHRRTEKQNWRGGQGEEKSFQSQIALGLLARTFVGLGKAGSL